MFSHTKVYFFPAPYPYFIPEVGPPYARSFGVVSLSHVIMLLSFVIENMVLILQILDLCS